MDFRFDPAPGTDVFNLDPYREAEEESNGIPVDLYREGDHYILHADLPGLDPGSLHIRVEGQLLTVSGHRTLRDLSAAHWLVRDRCRGFVQRHFLLGSGVNAAGITAQYNCGILILHLPVDPAHRRRKVRVQY